MIGERRAPARRWNLLLVIVVLAWLPSATHAYRVLRWSDPVTWGFVNGTHRSRATLAAPVHGDDVVVPHGVWLVVDVPATPVLNRLAVVGTVELGQQGSVPDVELRVRLLIAGVQRQQQLMLWRGHRHTASWCWATYTLAM